MILLDTNVISELRKARTGKADPRVIAFAEALAPEALFLSVVTVMELELGVSLMERRDVSQGALLRRWLEEQVLSAFDGRILPVDLLVARRAASLHVPDPRPERDTLIAATAHVHGLTVATRNIGDFERTGVSLINPWHHSAP